MGQTGAAVLRNRTRCWVIGVSAEVLQGLGHTILWVEPAVGFISAKRRAAIGPLM